MWKMWKGRSHLSMEGRHVRPQINAAAAVRHGYKEDLALWLEQKDTCVSSIYEAVKMVPEEHEIVDQYVLDKEMLPTNDSNKEVLAKELCSLVERFCGGTQYKLRDLNFII